MDNADKLNYKRYLEKLPKLKALLSKEELEDVERFQLISQSTQLDSFDGEQWVDFRDTNGLYSISTYSRIRRNIIFDGSPKMEEKIIKQNKQKGYCHTMISVNNIQTSFRVHRELAIHFIPNPNRLPMANHKTGIRDDNRIGNLEWSDNSNNQLQSYLQLREPSRAMLGKTGKDCNNSQKILQFSLDGVFIKEWDAIADAGRFYNISGSCISVAIQRSKPSTGFLWEYKTPPTRKRAKTGKRLFKKIPIVQYDLLGNFIKDWDSVTEAAKSLGGFATLISKACKGKSNTSYGFKWEYKND